MENVYMASVNPMHNCHLNTFNQAEKLLGEKVFLCICQSGLKDKGIFSLEERVEIAHNAYGIPYNQITVLSTKEQIISVIEKATWIIRAIRSKKDMDEIKRLVEHYNVVDSFRKILPIDVPLGLRLISSSRLIEQIKDRNYKEENNWVPPGIVSLIKQKLNLV